MTVNQVRVGIAWLHTLVTLALLGMAAGSATMAVAERSERIRIEHRYAQERGLMRLERDFFATQQDCAAVLVAAHELRDEAIAQCRGGQP